MPTISTALSVKLPTLIKPHTWLAATWINAQKNRGAPYIGRFAPSPSGLLHQGSLIAALASYLHAHWHGGQWLVRMEDVDASRCSFEWGEQQLATLRRLGFIFNEPIMWQSQRYTAYQEAFAQLHAHHHIYACTCTRKDLNERGLHDEQVCQQGQAVGKPIRSWRFKVNDTPIVWRNAHEPMCEILTERVGDFVIRNGDDDWTYQMAVVIDDAAQAITHVVRGADLLDSTARQIALQQVLNLPRPQYNHFALLLNADGSKLSKSEQAPELSKLKPVETLIQAWCFLGGHAFTAQNIDDFWQTVLMARF